MKSEAGLKDFYKHYKGKSKEPVSHKVFAAVFKDIMEEVYHEMVFSNFEYHAPARMGTFSIRKRKTKVKFTDEGEVDTRNLAMDFKGTKELWAKDPEAKANKQRVFHLNRHTEGYRHKFFWSRLTCNIPNHSAYEFKVSRDHGRRFSAEIQNPSQHIDFYEY